MKKFLFLLCLLSLPVSAMEICVFDGYLKDTGQIVIAASSDGFCGGLQTGPGTGVVTHRRNAVGHGESNVSGKVYLYVDGRRADSANYYDLLEFDTRGLAKGAVHSLQGMYHDNLGNEIWSPVVTVVVD